MVMHPNRLVNSNLAFWSMMFLLALSFLLVLPAHAANPCKQAGKQLRGAYEATQGAGGIWGFMEKARALRGDSMIGFQVDSKLQRTVVYFETLCKEGKPPSPETFRKIASLVEMAMAINNKSPERTAPKILLKEIKTLNQKLDSLLKELGI